MVIVSLTCRPQHYRSNWRPTTVTASQTWLPRVGSSSRTRLGSRRKSTWGPNIGAYISSPRRYSGRYRNCRSSRWASVMCRVSARYFWIWRHSVFNFCLFVLLQFCTLVRVWHWTRAGTRMLEMIWKWCWIRSCPRDCRIGILVKDPMIWWEKQSHTGHSRIISCIRT